MFSRLTSPFIRIVTDLPAISMSFPGTASTSASGSQHERNVEEEEVDARNGSNTSIVETCAEVAQDEQALSQMPGQCHPNCVLLLLAHFSYRP